MTFTVGGYTTLQDQIFFNDLKEKASMHIKIFHVEMTVMSIANVIFCSNL